MKRRPGLQRGVSLVELMVALVIGLMTVLAVVQMMSTYGRQQRLGVGVLHAVLAEAGQAVDAGDAVELLGVLAEEQVGALAHDALPVLAAQLLDPRRLHQLALRSGRHRIEQVPLGLRDG